MVPLQSTTHKHFWTRLIGRPILAHRTLISNCLYMREAKIPKILKVRHNTEQLFRIATVTWLVLPKIIWIRVLTRTKLFNFSKIMKGYDLRKWWSSSIHQISASGTNNSPALIRCTEQVNLMLLKVTKVQKILTKITVTCICNSLAFNKGISTPILIILVLIKTQVW